MKKYVKWMFLALALVVTVLVTGCTQDETESTTIPDMTITQDQQIEISDQQITTPISSYKIGWNIDRDLYTDDEGNSIRKQSGQFYRLRFAIDGGQSDLLFESKELVSLADSMKIMGLVVNDDGIVTDVVSVDEFTGGIGLMNYCVTEVTENTVTCKLLMSGLSPQITYTFNEDTLVYDISDSGVLCGVPGTLERGCRIWAVLNSDGTLGYAYISKPFQKQPVYWNMDRKYDSVTKQTTRESDSLGYYTYDFAVDGKQVQLRTRDFAVASKIDSFAAKCMSLNFDEDGYIISASGANAATGSNSLASWHHVIDITDEGFTAYKFTAGSDQGNTAVGNFSADCKVYDVSARAAQVGAETELRLYDQVHCLRDSFGDVCVIFVVTRYEEADIYWNAERKYNNNTNATTRIPDADGWYYLRMACNGSLRTLKTKDKAIVDYIDSRAAKNVAMRVDGDVITEAFSAGLTFTGQTFCSWAVVTDIGDDGLLTAVKDGKTTFTGYMTDDCKVFNVSPTASYTGVSSTLYEGDKIHALKSIDGSVNTIFIVDRPIQSPVYWNISRKYDSANGTTARTPDAEGWYYYTFAVDGQQKTLKTNKEHIATAIDKISTSTMGLWEYKGVIVDVYTYTEIEGYTGSVGGWFTVTNMDGTTVTLEDLRPTSANFGKVYTIDVSEKTPVYNVSNMYDSHVGEPTQIRLGDQLFTLVNKDTPVHVFVVSRVFTAYCEKCQQQVQWTSWNGKSVMENGEHYYLAGDISQTSQLRIEKDRENCLHLNSHNITVMPVAGRAFNIYGTLNLMGEGTITGTNDAVNMAAVTYIQNGGTFNMYSGTLTSQYAAPRAGIVMVQGTFNMYGGTILNGKSDTNGGNLEILNTGIFNMYDGLISGGTAAANGGSIYSTGLINIFGGTIENGHAKEGGNIFMKSGTLVMTSGTLSGGAASGTGGNINYNADTANLGTVTVKGTSIVQDGTAGGKGGNMYIRWTGALYLGDEAVVTGGKAGGNGGGIVCYVCKPTISGSVQVTGNEKSDLFLDGNDASIATVVLDDLSENAKIGIYMMRPGMFVSSITEELADCFFSNHDDHQVVFDGNKLTLEKKSGE